MKRKIIYIVVLLIFFSIGVSLGINIGLFFEWNENDYYDRSGPWPMLTAEDKGYMPDNGFVPDERTAIKIAKIVWEPVFEMKHLIWNKYKYRIRLINEVDKEIWVIEGVSQWGKLGGGPFIKIDRARGTILEVSHTY